MRRKETSSCCEQQLGGFEENNIKRPVNRCDLVRSDVLEILHAIV